MQNDEPETIFNKARKLVTEILYYEFEEQLVLSVDKDNDDIKELLRFIIRIKQNVNFYLLNDPIDAQEIWENIRENSTVTNFVFNMHNELILSLGFDEFNKMIVDIAQAYSIQSTQDSIIDDYVQLKMPVKADILNLLSNNTWLVPLYPLSYCDITDLLKYKF